MPRGAPIRFANEIMREILSRPAVGNDVIDLSFADCPAYEHIEHLERACCVEERRTVLSAASPSTALAAMWCAKEAVFKVLRQEGVECSFVPRQFVVEIEGGSMNAGGVRLAVRHSGIERIVMVTASERWVHAVASSRGDRAVRWIVAPIEASDDQDSQTARESAAARRIGARLLMESGFGGASLDFAGRIPRVRLPAGEVADAALSLSHHGGFAAAAIAYGTTGGRHS